MISLKPRTTGKSHKNARRHDRNLDNREFYNLARNVQNQTNFNVQCADQSTHSIYINERIPTRKIMKRGMLVLINLQLNGEQPEG